MKLRFATALKQASEDATSTGTPQDIEGEFSGGGPKVVVQPRVLNTTRGEAQMTYFVLLEGEWHLAPSLNALTTLLTKQGYRPGNGTWSVVASQLTAPPVEEMPVATGVGV